MTHGEIQLIDFGIPVGSLPSKIRPAVVMQNDLLGIKDLFSKKKKQDFQKIQQL